MRGKLEHGALAAKFVGARAWTGTCNVGHGILPEEELREIVALGSAENQAMRPFAKIPRLQHICWNSAICLPQKQAHGVVQL